MGLIVGLVFSCLVMWGANESERKGNFSVYIEKGDTIHLIQSEGYNSRREAQAAIKYNLKHENNKEAKFIIIETYSRP